MSELVYTHENKRVESKSELSLEPILFNIRVNSLQELDDTKKIEKDYKELYNDILEWLRLLTSSSTVSYRLDIGSKPVYVKSTNSGEEIVYNSNMMEIDKLYLIDYKGEKWALRKNDKTVEFMKFYPSA